MIRSAQARAARKRYREMAPVLNEQSRRRFVALEARGLGRGGVCLMSRISGLARSTIYHGLSDIRHNVSAPAGRTRKEGGGRKKKTTQDPSLVLDLKRLVEPVTRGDPMQPLLWTTRSLRNLVKELAKKGHKVCPMVVGDLCRPTARRGKVASTSIATRNFSISTRRPGRSWLRTSRSYRLIRKRRNWWAISRTTAGNGVQKAGLNSSHSRFHRSQVEPRRAVSTTSPTMSDGSVSARITTPPVLPSMRSVDGGGPWERNVTPKPSA